MAGRQDVFAFLRFSWQGSSGGSPLPGIRYCLEQYGAGTECGNPSAARARARQPDSEGSYIYPAAAARQSRRRVLIGRSTLRVLPITLCHPFGSTDKVRTAPINGSRPNDYPCRWAFIASPLHRVVRRSAFARSEELLRRKPRPGNTPRAALESVSAIASQLQGIRHQRQVGRSEENMP